MGKPFTNCRKVNRISLQYKLVSKYDNPLTEYIHTIGASLLVQMVKNLPAMHETQFDPWIGEIPWRGKWLPNPVFLPEDSMDREAWQPIM